jgi:hypothetical protein
MGKSTTIEKMRPIALEGKKGKYAWKDGDSIKFYYRTKDSTVASYAMRFPHSIEWGYGPSCVITVYSLKDWVAFPLDDLAQTRVHLALPDSSAVYKIRPPEPAV